MQSSFPSPLELHDSEPFESLSFLLGQPNSILLLCSTMSHPSAQERKRKPHKRTRHGPTSRWEEPQQFQRYTGPQEGSYPTGFVPERNQADRPEFEAFYRNNWAQEGYRVAPLHPGRGTYEPGAADRQNFMADRAAREHHHRGTQTSREGNYRGNSVNRGNQNVMAGRAVTERYYDTEEDFQTNVEADYPNQSAMGAIPSEVEAVGTGFRGMDIHTSRGRGRGNRRGRGGRPNVEFAGRNQEHAGIERLGGRNVVGNEASGSGYVPPNVDVQIGNARVRDHGRFSHNAPERSLPEPGLTTRRDVMAWGMTMPLIVTNEASVVQEWVQKQSGELFGLDIEWRPNFVRGQDNKVALLQLCGENECLIIQMLYLDKIPNALVEFLLDPAKRLAGVGIWKDLEKLLEDHGLACRGEVELAALASDILKRKDLKMAGLKTLMDKVLGLTMIKQKRTTMSNWENPFLSSAQAEYACKDAWAAFVIFQYLMSVQN